MCFPQIYVYPIKSLRATRVTEALATKNGLAYDRKLIFDVAALGGRIGFQEA